jgi:hypothetical protein
MVPSSFAGQITRLTENQLEDVVEDEPLASGVLAELESLRVRERALLVVDLIFPALVTTP